MENVNDQFKTRSRNHRHYLCEMIDEHCFPITPCKFERNVTSWQIKYAWKMRSSRVSWKTDVTSIMADLVFHEGTFNESKHFGNSNSNTSICWMRSIQRSRRRSRHALCKSNLVLCHPRVCSLIHQSQMQESTGRQPENRSQILKNSSPVIYSTTPNRTL